MGPQSKIKQKHVHKLLRHKFKTGNIVYFCVEDCNYKCSPALALGKTVICWRCGESFRMNDYSVRLAKPHCETCHAPKIPVAVIEESAQPDSSSESLDAGAGLQDANLNLRERLARTFSQFQAQPDDVVDTSDEDI